MITTKQRAELKGMASLIQPAFQIGKGGVNDAQVAQVIGSKAVLYKRNEKQPVIKLKSK